MSSDINNEQEGRNRFQEKFPGIDSWDRRMVKKVYHRYEGKEDIRRAAKIVSYCGDPRLWAIIIISTAIYGLIIKDFSMAVAFGTAIVQSYAIYFIFKKGFSRPRPFVAMKSDGIKRLDKTGHGYSFPSGHSHHSTIMAGMFILWFGPYPLWAVLLILGGLAAYNIAVPYSRLISGCHYPSDVLFALFEAYLALALHWFVTMDFYIMLYKLAEPFIFFF